MADDQADLPFVAEASNGADTVALARTHRPDLMLMDVQMPAMDGLTATRELLRDLQPPRILMLTTYRPGAGGAR